MTTFSNGDVSVSQTLTDNDHIYPAHVNELRVAVNTIETDIDALLTSKLDVYNVMEYGAVGDGTTDDTAAIQAAIDDVPTKGGIVYFPVPSNYYLVASGMTVTGQMVFKGAGRNTSIISSSSATAILFDVETDNPVKFMDLGFSGSVTKTGGSGIKFRGTSGGGNTNNFSGVYRCQINNQYIGLDFTSATLYNVYDCYIAQSYLAGIAITNSVNPDGGDMTFIGNTLDSTRANTYGVLHQSGGGVRFIGNKIFRHAVGYELNIANSATAATLLFIEGNSIEGQTDASIRLERTTGTGALSGITIVGNEISSASGTVSVHIRNGGYSNVIINSNYIIGNPASTIGLNLDVVTSAVVQGNFIVNHATGMVIGASAANVYYGPNGYFSCSTTVTNGSATSGAYGTTMTE